MFSSLHAENQLPGQSGAENKDYRVGTARMAEGSEGKLQLVQRHIRAFPDFPKKGILFRPNSSEVERRAEKMAVKENRDICPILKSPAALTAVIDLFEEHVRSHHQQVDLIIGLDARGFLFGPLLAQRLGVGFVLVRKKGKLPGPTVCVAYDLEYGTVKNATITAKYQAPTTGVKAEAEVQEDAVAPGQKVLIIDDLLATGGTLYAACELMKKQQAQVQGCMVIIELKDLNGADRLKPHSLFSLLQY